MAQVKGYASIRLERTAEPRPFATGQAILDGAERQFLDAGYAATTLAAIAKEAGVSVETIYKVFGGKSGLVRAIYERGLTGRGRVPAFTRSDEMRERESDPAEIMRNWGVLAAEVAAMVMPIRQLIRSSAATDPEMSSLLETSDNDRLERARHHARFSRRPRIPSGRHLARPGHRRALDVHLSRNLRTARAETRLVVAAVRGVHRRLHDHRSADQARLTPPAAARNCVHSGWLANQDDSAGSPSRSRIQLMTSARSSP